METEGPSLIGRSVLGERASMSQGILKERCPVSLLRGVLNTSSDNLYEEFDVTLALCVEGLPQIIRVKSMMSLLTSVLKDFLRSSVWRV